MVLYVDASLATFQFYCSGIYDDANCGSNLNHAVLLVGYGTANGQDFWIIRNSWSDQWGEKGYMRIKRGCNQCGISLSAHFIRDQDLYPSGFTCQT